MVIGKLLQDLHSIPQRADTLSTTYADEILPLPLRIQLCKHKTSPAGLSPTGAVAQPQSYKKHAESG